MTSVKIGLCVASLTLVLGCDAASEITEVAADLSAEAEAANTPMASVAECTQMIRNGTKIKAVAGGPFGDLSPEEQNAELDRIMAESEMLEAVQECTTTVNKPLAACIIAATDEASFQACRALE